MNVASSPGSAITFSAEFICQPAATTLRCSSGLIDAMTSNGIRWCACQFPGFDAASTALRAVALLALSLPDRYEIMDQLTCIGIGVGVAALMSRYATIHARPTAEGLYVRNLGPGELVPWEQITAVRFSQGMPWPRSSSRIQPATLSRK